MEEVQQLRVIESPPRDETTGFDLRTEIRDAKTGKLIKFQPYTLLVDRHKGSVYCRAGKYYSLNGEEVEGYTPEAQAQVAQAQSGQAQANSAAKQQQKA